MDAPKQSTIDEKIASISRRITWESFQHLPRNEAEELYRFYKPEKRIEFFKKILHHLELQRTEPDWVIVCKPDQNDHDEVWKRRGPGPDLASANRPPGSSMLSKVALILSN